jgi:hypothetical protein
MSEEATNTNFLVFGLIADTRQVAFPSYMAFIYILSNGYCHLLNRSFVGKAKEGRHIRMSND